MLADVLGEAPLVQRGFRWSRDRWINHVLDLPEVEKVIRQLPDMIDREAVRLVAAERLGAGEVLAAFVPAMIWGYGNAEYGPMRVRWVLTGIRGADARKAPVATSVADKLGSAATVVRREGAVAGFRLLNNEGRVKHLGPAFFTKWLYFASASDGPDGGRAAPILDKQVVGWLDKHAGIKLNPNKTAAYQHYVEVLGAWGAEFERTPAQVEQAIFGLQTGRT